MTTIDKLEFRSVFIDGTQNFTVGNNTCINNRELMILSYSRENFSIYFSLQSVAQCINELLEIYNARDLFHNEFYEHWRSLSLKCMTEFELTLLVPINLVIDLESPLPLSIMRTRYLNDRYHDTIMQYSNYTNIVNDVFCIAEINDLTTPRTGFRHKFMSGIGFLSLISILKPRFIRTIYSTFFNIEMLHYEDVEYIYITLILNRRNMPYTEISNVFQINESNSWVSSNDMTASSKELFIETFNKGCRIFKSFAFNIMDTQSMYFSTNLRIVSQFGMDQRAVEKAFLDIPKIPEDINLTEEQKQLLCKPPSTDSLAASNSTELTIMHSIIRIHLMIQRMTNVAISEDDLEFYKKLLKARFSIDLEELVYNTDPLINDELVNELDDTILSYETINGKRIMIRNYTMGDILWEFLDLYLKAQRHISTVWLCQFIRMSCNPRYAGLVNIMAEFVPNFQRFFTNDFNINSINNMIIFLQGMCKPDEDRQKALKNFRQIQHMDVRNFKTFSLTRYKSYNSNPLITFIELVLSPISNHRHNSNYVMNLSLLCEEERHNLVTLKDPNEKQFIDYIYDLMTSNDSSNKNDCNDEQGYRQYQHIDYDNVVPLISTNTFNENNVNTSALQLFNATLNQTTFFHELTNRIIYKVPGVVCNIITK